MSKSIDDLTELAEAPAVGDKLIIQDISATVTKFLTVLNLLKGVTSLTELAEAPAVGDSVLLYDLSVTTMKKLTIANLLLAVTSFPATTKMLFKQAAAPTGWTVDDTIQDNSMVVYRRSASYGADGGSQNPTSMATPAQDIDVGTDAGSIAAGANVVLNSNELVQTVAGASAYPRVLNTINSVSLTPLYTHVIVATKN